MTATELAGDSLDRKQQNRNGWRAAARGQMSCATGTFYDQKGISSHDAGISDAWSLSVGHFDRCHRRLQSRRGD
ncbi:hypothetical protein HYQ45_006985 [Verticillium longisporum]|uniref:Uncharacterized protein n=1 Tax=Verticillium longisporum TaxID=100787 RepID=A0A8I3AQS2_VERLO|nr:hypothetical protein HYQ45_006985 [Verticillium longisporum]